MARSFIDPEVDDFLEVVMDQANYEFEMKIHKITENDVNLGKKLKNSSYRNEGFIAIGVKKISGEMVFAPKPDFEISEGMEVLLVGSAKEKHLE